MNRDREAQTWLATRVASARRTIAGWSPEVRAAVGLALSVEGGVTEHLREAEQMLTAVRDGDASQSAVDRTVSRLRAALTPRVEE